MSALASILRSRVWSTDVKQTYLQSIEPLQQRILTKSSALEFNLEPEECFELLRLLHKLADVGDLWHKPLENRLLNELHMQPSMGYPSLYLYFENVRIPEISGTFEVNNFNV